jgi:hypothetical protein
MTTYTNRRVERMFQNVGGCVARRAHLTVREVPADDFTRVLRGFLAPVLDDLRRPGRQGTWPPGGPWR